MGLALKKIYRIK